MPKISIIIPVYNAEAYVSKALDSVLSQTLTDIEVICIDDGSTDKSPEILEKYRAQDSRIKLIKQNKQGPANARNTGIKNALSDIITFLDADDWVYSDSAYEKIYCEMINNDLDLYIFNHYEYDSEKSVLLKDTQCKYIFNWEDEDYDKTLSKDEFLKYSFKFSPFPWDKFYKKSLLNDNNILFPINLPAGEDSAFALYCILFAHKVKFSHDKHIVYRINLNTSLTKAKIHDCLDYPIQVSQAIYDFLNERNLYDKYRIEYLSSTIKRLLGHYLRQIDCAPERCAYINLVADFLKKLNINRKTLMQIAKFDVEAMGLLHKHLNYPVFLVYKLFNILPVFKIKIRLHLKKYYILGIPVAEVINTGYYSKDIYLLGRLIKIFSATIF